MTKSIDWKDIIIRALKTFAQGFLAALALTLPSANLTDVAVVKSLLMGALAGGISALMNMIMAFLK